MMLKVVRAFDDPVSRSLLPTHVPSEEHAIQIERTDIMETNANETLFLWDGILFVIETKDETVKNTEAETQHFLTETADGIVSLKWKGTWLGIDNADATKVETPKRGAFDEYVSSENTFEVMGDATAGGKAENDLSIKEGLVVCCASSLYRVKMTDGPGYDLHDLKGNENKCKDNIHDIYFQTLRWKGNLRDQVENVVFALGENEFGKFISVGWIRVGNRVTMARRYVDMDDERSKWDIDDLRRSVFDELASVSEDGSVSMRIPPWQCVAMNALAGKISKRQKIEE